MYRLHSRVIHSRFEKTWGSSSLDLHIPTMFDDFLAKNGIHISLYDTPIGKHVEPVGDSHISVDRGSVYAVDCLGIRPGMHVLDLCCAPGTKMVLAHNYLKNTGSYTGVDISLQRLYTARALAKQFGLNNVRLFNVDGTAFNAPPVVTDAVFRDEAEMGRIDEFNKKNRLVHSATPFRRFPCRFAACPMYDRVFVDVPCSHDGSIKHVKALTECSWKGANIDEHFDYGSMKELCDLQLRLLLRGIDMLTPSGLLLYSTCSLCCSQNSMIVNTALRLRPECSIKSLPRDDWFDGEAFGIIHPRIHGCGSLFLCRIVKTSTTAG